MPGEYRNPDGVWTPASSMTMRNGHRSADGTTLTFRLETGDAFRLVRGAEARWSPVVHTPDDAVAGDYGMGWQLSGTIDGGRVRVGA